MIYLTKISFTNNHNCRNKRRKKTKKRHRGCVLGEIINDTSSVFRGPLF